MNVTDEVRNIQYSGKLVFNKGATITGSLDDAAPVNNDMVDGMTFPSWFGVNINDYSDDKYKPLSTKAIAISFTHEVLHQGGVAHPTDPDNEVKDVKLIHLKERKYKTTPTTDKKKIFSNIMLYGLYNVDGKNVDKTRGGVEGGTSVSPGQIKQLDDNIKKGKVNGEAARY